MVQENRMEKMIFYLFIYMLLLQINAWLSFNFFIIIFYLL